MNVNTNKQYLSMSNYSLMKIENQQIYHMNDLFKTMRFRKKEEEIIRSFTMR